MHGLSAHTALVVGGTGPTGPHVVRGLVERGYEVTILHRGVHESPELDDVEHIHADPHFRETLDEALQGRSFDVVVSMYGRMRHVAAAVAGKTASFIGVSGFPGYAGFDDPQSLWPVGMPVNADETSPVTGVVGSDAPVNLQFSSKIAAAERAVLGTAAQNGYAATLFRYPSIYGPRQVYPIEWSVVRRVQDGRELIILPDNGLALSPRCAAVNAAEFLLSAVGRVHEVDQEIFNAVDLQQFTWTQWAQVVSRSAGRELTVESLPYELAVPGRAITGRTHRWHIHASADKARRLLDYREHTPAADALADAVQWLLANPPSAQVQERFQDKFDYAHEDALLRAYREATAGLEDLAGTVASRAHAYAHPKAPNAGADHHGR